MVSAVLKLEQEAIRKAESMKREPGISSSFQDF